MFDNAVYTDVSMEESLDGRAGFNFQALSSGFTKSDQAFVESQLLHRVVTGWEIHHDPLDHPPSFLSAAGSDRFYVARGRSTGLTSMRQGNQVTQAITTTDRDDFGTYRPAQLYGAVRWDLQKSPDQHPAPWAAPLEISPEFEAQALQQLVAGSPAARALFPRFLTAIENAAAAELPTKLILVHRDLDTVMRWIALGSLFLDMSTALRLRIRALISEPLVAAADIVGTSPDFGAVPTPDAPPPACTVVDLERLTISGIEISESAAVQSRWFLDGDTDEALAAIDLARSWEVALGADLATRAAALVSGIDPLRSAEGASSALATIERLAGSGLADDLVVYADELLAPLSAESISGAAGPVLGRATAAARAAGADSVVAGLLEVTARSASEGSHDLGTWAGEITKQRATVPPWTDPDAERRARDAGRRLLISEPTDSLHTILAAVGALDAAPDPDQAADVIARFGDHWSRTPGLAVGREIRPYRAETTRRAIGSLIGDLERGDQPAVSALMSGDWEWIADESRSPLDGWMSAARLAATAPSARTVSAAQALPGIPAKAWFLCLANATLPADSAWVTHWVDTHPQLHPATADWIGRQLAAALGGGSATPARQLLSRLTEPDIRFTDPRLSDILRDNASIRRHSQEAQSDPRAQNNPPARAFAAEVVKQVPFFLPELGEILLTSDDVRAVTDLERVAGDLAAEAVTSRLASRFASNRAVEALDLALFAETSAPSARADAARAFIVATADTRSGRRTIDNARPLIDQDLVDVLDDILASGKRGRFTRNLVRGGKRLSRFTKEQ